MESILAAIGTILSIAAIAVARDLRDGKSIFKKNGTAESAKTMRELRDSQLELRHHFNDTTTQLLTEIRDEVRKGNAKLEEFDKYGLPVRK